MLSGGRPVLGFPEQFEIKIYTIYPETMEGY
jgi:hypothetical protein